MELTYTNFNNDRLDLLNNQDHFVLIAAEGLHGVDLDYSESDSPYMDGTDINNVRALPRGIILTFQLIGDVQEAIDLFTSVVKSKQTAILTETDENGREITVKGYVNIPPYTRLSAACLIQLEMNCGQPYWEDVLTMVTVISDTIPLLYFPMQGRGITAVGIPFGEINVDREKTIVNSGDTSVGMTIQIVATNNTSNPRISCSTGKQNGWYMQINIDLQSTDVITISTHKGNKYITLNGSLYYGNTPILSLLTIVGDDWLQLEQGKNTFNITASDDTKLYFELTYKRRYE